MITAGTVKQWRQSWHHQLSGFSGNDVSNPSPALPTSAVSSAIESVNLYEWGGPLLLWVDLRGPEVHPACHLYPVRQVPGALFIPALTQPLLSAKLRPGYLWGRVRARVAELCLRPAPRLNSIPHLFLAGCLEHGNSGCHPSEHLMPLAGRRWFIPSRFCVGCDCQGGERCYNYGVFMPSIMPRGRAPARGKIEMDIVPAAGKNVSPSDLVNSRSREFGCECARIVLQFGGKLTALLPSFQSNCRTFEQF